MTKKFPVTILTGFLGAGKTTLLQNLLRNSEGRRIAVIINEFGELGIDGELLRGSGCGCPEEDIVELSNGCFCCTVLEEFLPAMLKLMERRESLESSREPCRCAIPIPRSGSSCSRMDGRTRRK